MVLIDGLNAVNKRLPLLLATAAIASFSLLNSGCTPKKQAEAPVSIDKNLLMGVWGSSPEENASFQILQDTIYYVDADRRLKYELSGKRFVCFDEKGDTNYSCSIDKLDKDSLVMKNTRDNSITGFTRVH